MRIAQVAPLYERVPPAGYGGTERVVSWLTEELIRQGHEVTLFASADSITSARLIPGSRRALRGDADCWDPLCRHIAMVESVAKRAKEFDVIHFHIDYLHFPVSRHRNLRQVTTLHGRLDLPDLVPLYREFDDMPVISISLKQRNPISWARWVGNVYHGLPEDSLCFGPGPGKYLAFIGRISPEKRPDRLIEIADRAGIELKIAAKVDRADEEYFKSQIEPLLNNPRVEYIGEIGDHEKSEFLGNALACVYPIDWPEPFGLAMIEAMACGTPTVAFRKGSVPEIVDEGVSGFIVESIDEAVKALERVRGLSRQGCRRSFERRFTAARMASDYLKIYEEQVESNCDRLPAGSDIEPQWGKVV